MKETENYKGENSGESQNRTMTEEETSVNQSAFSKESVKIKNLTSAVILLTGLFLGSLFVDFLQMIRGQGFSQRVLKNTDVVSQDGRTWVAYSDPVVKVKILTDDECSECLPDQVLVWLRKIVPTMMAEKIDIKSDSASKLLDKHAIKSIPAFIFSKEIEETDFYNQAGTLFTAQQDGYLLKGQDLGIAPGKFLSLPPIEEKDVKTGSTEAKVKIITFFDYQCPYCKNFQEKSLSKLVNEYGDKILVVYKNMPLDFHAQAGKASQAVLCANEQGKAISFIGKLFENQSSWGSATDTRLFKNYATQLNLQNGEFSRCLDEDKYKNQVESDKKLAAEFGISGTPSVFINHHFKNGLISFEDMKKIIDEELAR